ncbi:MAG: hypothetical protein HQL60_09170 [Magnetococcales bacterium]|nr:hypothetical protein [Magnetococcales bacterium]
MRITHFLAMVSCGLMLTLSMEGIAAPATHNDSSQQIILAQAAGGAEGGYEKAKSGKRHHARRHSSKRKHAAKHARSSKSRSSSGMDAQSAE